ncbi:hypothetical protein E4417_08825 [Stenotrophomonas maltophilia]|nr:hypothetical protein E4417_08825 [Stenotrophomonas maltophilia]
MSWYTTAAGQRPALPRSVPTAAEPATRATQPGHFPETPLRPNTPTRPGRGKGPDRPSHPGPDHLPIGESVMRNRVTRRYFQQLFALYAGFVQSR